MKHSCDSMTLLAVVTFPIWTLRRSSSTKVPPYICSYKYRWHAVDAQPWSKQSGAWLTSIPGLPYVDAISRPQSKFSLEVLVCLNGSTTAAWCTAEVWPLWCLTMMITAIILIASAILILATLLHHHTQNVWTLISMAHWWLPHHNKLSPQPWLPHCKSSQWRVESGWWRNKHLYLL